MGGSTILIGAIFLVLVVVGVVVFLVLPGSSNEKTISITVDGYTGIAPTGKIITSNGDYNIIKNGTNYEFKTAAPHGTVATQDIVVSEYIIWKIASAFDLNVVNSITATLIDTRPEKTISITMNGYAGTPPSTLMVKTSEGDYNIIKNGTNYEFIIAAPYGTVSPQDIILSEYVILKIDNTFDLNVLNSITITLVNKTPEKTVPITVDGYTGPAPTAWIKTSKGECRITKNGTKYEFSISGATFDTVIVQDIVVSEYIIWKIENEFDLNVVDSITATLVDTTPEGEKTISITVDGYTGTPPSTLMIKTSEGEYNIIKNGTNYEFTITEPYGTVSTQDIIIRETVLWKITGPFDLNAVDSITATLEDTTPEKTIPITVDGYTGPAPGLIKTSNGAVSIRKNGTKYEFMVRGPVFATVLVQDIVVSEYIIWKITSTFDLNVVDSITATLMDTRTEKTISIDLGVYTGTPPSTLMVKTSEGDYNIIKNGTNYEFVITQPFGTVSPQDIILREYVLWKIENVFNLNAVDSITTTLEDTTPTKTIPIIVDGYTGPAPKYNLSTSNGSVTIRQNETKYEFIVKGPVFATVPVQDLVVSEYIIWKIENEFDLNVVDSITATLVETKTISITVDGYSDIAPTDKIKTSNGDYYITKNGTNYEFLITKPYGIVSPIQEIYINGVTLMWKILQTFDLNVVSSITARLYTLT